MLTSIAGTLYYMAPEVLDGEYGHQCDVWSLGVVLYVILVGYLPFTGKDTRDLIRKISDGHVSFPPKDWRNITMDAKDLIKHCLVTDPKERYTVA